MSFEEKHFTSLGGMFLTPTGEIRNKYSKIKILVFDWDGVFNDGLKFPEEGSLFSEPDSMGVNLLRFNYYLDRNKLIHSYIVTGLNNEMAVTFAEREHFDGIYLNFKFKEEAFDRICKHAGCGINEIAYVFDDVLDFGVAKSCGLSFFVRRKASPLTYGYVIENKFCDYVTGLEGGQHAVREVCELLIGLNGNFNETVEKRIAFKGQYEEYYTFRNQVKTEIIRNK